MKHKKVKLTIAYNVTDFESVPWLMLFHIINVIFNCNADQMGNTSTTDSEKLLKTE